MHRWLKELKLSSTKFPTQITFDSFVQLFFQVANVDEHLKFVHEKPVDAWIDAIETGTEKRNRIAHVYD